MFVMLVVDGNIGNNTKELGWKPDFPYIFKKLFEPHVLFFNAHSLDVLLNEFPFYDIEIVGCGRELDNIPKERSMKKVFRRQIGKSTLALNTMLIAALRYAT